LKSLVERPRQKAEASVANPARSRSSRLRKTTSRIESRTGDCGITAGAGAPGVAAAVLVPGADGRVTCARVVSRRGGGGVRTFDCASSGELPSVAAIATMALVWRSPVEIARWCIRNCLGEGSALERAGLTNAAAAENSPPPAPYAG